VVNLGEVGIDDRALILDMWVVLDCFRHGSTHIHFLAVQKSLSHLEEALLSNLSNWRWGLLFCYIVFFVLEFLWPLLCPA
jgi:hypothetical protein